MPIANSIEDAPPETANGENRSAVTVIFTTWTATAAALRMAEALAAGWNSSITLIAAQVVPWPADLHEKHVPVEFSSRRLTEMAARCSVETSVNLYLCRDRVETLLGYIPPERIVVIGVRPGEWRNPDLRLARRLRRAGLEVVIVEESAAPAAIARRARAAYE